MGRRVRGLRRDANLTLEELAERADLHANYVGLVERGTANPSLDVITVLASALHVEPGALIDPHAVATPAELRRTIRARVGALDEAQLRRVLRVLDAIR